MNHKFPWFSFEDQLHRVYKWLVFKRRFKGFGKGTFVSPFSEIINMEHIRLGNHVRICSGAWIFVVEEYAGERFDPEIVIDDNTYIGRHVTLSCANRISIGKDVTIGDNVYIADCGHRYDDVRVNVTKQKLSKGRVVIGDRAWIGKNSVILTDVEIGENAIVGANSFVNRAVPPYTIVSGNPARPLKQYDFTKEAWVPVPGRTA